jgi:hypothetical protein
MKLVSWCPAVLSMCLVACGGSGGDGDGSGGGSGGIAAGGGSGGSSAAGGTGGTGAVTSGGGSGGSGTGASGGAAGGGGSAGSTGSGGTGGLDPQSTACADFPASVQLGPTIDATTTGAILCFDPTSNECRLTTNTYSDGVNPCPGLPNVSPPHDVVRFFASASGNFVNMPEGWTFVSTSAGTINASFPNYLESVPTGTAVNVVVAFSDSSQYAIDFQFNGGSSFTLDSFSEN